jgi:sugar fermentation stimulation protein A
MTSQSEKQWVQALFVKRLNRFSAEVVINNQVVLVHVATTARMRELLIPCAVVMLTVEEGFKRKMHTTHG